MVVDGRWVQPDHLQIVWVVIEDLDIFTITVRTTRAAPDELHLTSSGGQKWFYLIAYHALVTKKIVR